MSPICGLRTRARSAASGDGRFSRSGSGSSVSPSAGGWIYGEQTEVSSTCSATTPHGQAGGFAIDQVTASSFRVAPNDGTPAFTCTSNSGGFSCPNRATFVMNYRPAVDAVVTVHATASGVFHDPSHGSGRQNATVDCAGTQCAAIGPLPCQFAVDFAIDEVRLK